MTAVALSVCSKWWLLPHDADSPFLLFVVAVLVSAWFGGRAAALLATVLATAAAGYFFLPETGAFALEDASRLAAVVLFFVVGVAISLLGGMMQTAHIEMRRASAEAARRAQVEQRLRGSEERLEKAFNLTPMVVTLTSLRSGKLLDVNDTFTRVTGYTRDEAVGRTTAELGLWARPSDREAELGAVRSLGQIRNLEYRFRTKAGHEIVGLLSAEVIEVDGESCALTVIADITERKRDEEALEAARARVQATVAAAEVGVWSWDIASRRITADANVMALFGLPATETEDVAAELFLARIDATDRARVQRSIRDALEHGDVYRAEYCVHTPEGQTRWIAARGKVQLDADGRPLSLNGVLIDISERKRAEMELEKARADLQDADRRKDEFLAMLAHELRNPLAPIRNAVHVLRVKSAGDPVIAQAHDIIDRQVDHMTRLVDDLLDVSRITRGKITLRKEPLPLAEIIETAIETARPLIDQHAHTLGVSLARDLILVDGDRARLVQVVGNLLSNAAKFTPRGGHISVGTRLAADQAVVTVRDTGIGLRPEAQSRIFALFTQEDSTLARSQGGLGIGLTLVRDLVALHGGHVEVESEGLGKGCEFRVLLPARVAAAVGASPPPRAERVATDRRRVLIVEDNPDTAESLRVLLEMQGHEVHVAGDGLNALRAFAEFEPDIAFIDLGLPELDGFEVARRLRKEEGQGRAILIALSGYGRDEDKERSAAAGFDRHLTKPVDPATVSALIRDLLPRGRVNGGASQSIH